MTITLKKTNLYTTNIILSQKNEFTISDVMSELTALNHELDIDSLRNVIERLCDSGLIIDCGSNFKLSKLIAG